MDSTSTISLGLIIAFVGITITVYNWNSQRVSKSINEGRWQGKVDEKLDTIINSFNILSSKIQDVEKDLHEYKHEVTEEINKLHTRLTVLEKKKTTKNTAE